MSRFQAYVADRRHDNLSNLIDGYCLAVAESGVPFEEHWIGYGIKALDEAISEGDSQEVMVEFLGKMMGGIKNMLGGLNGPQSQAPASPNPFQLSPQQKAPPAQIQGMLHAQAGKKYAPNLETVKKQVADALNSVLQSIEQTALANRDKPTYMIIHDLHTKLIDTINRQRIRVADPSDSKVQGIRNQYYQNLNNVSPDAQAQEAPAIAARLGIPEQAVKSMMAQGFSPDRMKEVWSKYNMNKSPTPDAMGQSMSQASPPPARPVGAQRTVPSFSF
jgi:hypothetical protein